MPASAMSSFRSGGAAWLLAAGAWLVLAPAYACDVVATSLSFGSINPLEGSPSDSVSSISVTCPVATPYAIAINAGSAGSFDGRRMTGGVSVLQYQIYADASRSLVWGDGTGGSTTVPGTADQEGTSHVVYGRVPDQPAAVPGAYSDTLLVTITY